MTARQPMPPRRIGDPTTRLDAETLALDRYLSVENELRDKLAAAIESNRALLACIAELLTYARQWEQLAREHLQLPTGSFTIRNQKERNRMLPINDDLIRDILENNNRDPESLTADDIVNVALGLDTVANGSRGQVDVPPATVDADDQHARTEAMRAQTRAAFRNTNRKA